MSHYLTSDHPAEMAGSLVNFLLLQITEIFHSQNVHPAGRVKHSDALFRLFRKLLAENYRKEHELQFYADSLHISQTYLSRVIRQISGKTVNNYIAEALYTDARRLLVFTDLTVKEIAEQLGFSDQSSFGKFFKKKSETSPANFRVEKLSSFTPQLVRVLYSIHFYKLWSFLYSSRKFAGDVSDFFLKNFPKDDWSEKPNCSAISFTDLTDRKSVV